jgi:diguanylate cyclase (GGDEF)-like protein
MASQKLFNRTVIGALALLAATVVLVILNLAWRRTDVIDNATRTAGNYASIIAEQVSNASQAIDLSLQDIVNRRVETGSREQFQAQATTQEFQSSLVEALKKLPQADVITITDFAGDIVATTRGFPRPEINLSDRDHFQFARDGRSRGLFVSAPVQNKVTGEWTVYFARRLETPGGEFLGVAVIGVLPSVFIQTQHSLTAIEGQTFALLRNDGVFLLRRQDDRDRTGWRMSPASQWYATVAGGGGLYYSPGFFHKVPRYVAVRPLARYPLVVNVGVSEDAILAVWRHRAAVVGLTALLVALACAILLRSMASMVRRLQDSRDRLREREARLARQAAELGRTNRRFDAALNNMSHGIAMFDADGALQVANGRFAEIYGLPAAKMAAGAKAVTIFPEGSRSAEIAAQRSQCGQSQWHDLLGDGRVVSVRLEALPDAAGWVSTHEDVTDEITALSRIEHLAGHDALTDLLNRASFMTALRNAHAREDGEGRTPAVLLVDLDGFKRVNDAFGHGVGDELLRQVATRLMAAAPRAVVARLGGDEFALLLRGTEAAGAAPARLAERLIGAIGKPFAIGALGVSVGVSIGVAYADPGDCLETDVERVMRRADLALYGAKRAGKNRHCLFDPQMETEFQNRTELLEELRFAIAAGGLQTHYQPIVSAASSEIVVMEALLRWRHPVRGWISPAVFVPLAEDAGLIGELGAFVLRRACADAASWPDSVRVAVNVSALQISQESFLDVLRGALDASGLPAHRLEIEITETALLHRSETTNAVLDAVRKSGVSIALDDFGIGYSSLSYLRAFPFNTVKIDKSFVDEIASHAGSAAIIVATTGLARAFDMATTAEGVETAEQAQLLRGAGVTHMQGYFFARPAAKEAWVVEDGRIRLPAEKGAIPAAA